MVSDTITHGHYCCIANHYIRGGPNTSNGFGSSEKGQTNWLAGELTHYLLHCQTIYIREGFPQRLAVYEFIGIQADYQFITILPPLSQLCHEVLSKFYLGTSEILPLGNEETLVLLI